MAYNLTNIQIQSLKEEGLRIVDKRGLNFESNEQRFLEYEERRLLERFRTYIYEADSDLSNEDKDNIINNFIAEMNMSSLY